MASDHQVRAYLACWFQLNRYVVNHATGQHLCPQPVLVRSSYSPAFEECWTCILQSQPENCYLEGTSQTIAELLTESWEFSPCPRCTVMIPLPKCPVLRLECPCSELHTWPNTKLPVPRPPLNTQKALNHICQRVTDASLHYAEIIDSEAV